MHTGEITPTELEANFRAMSLRELSLEAAQLASLLEDEPDEILVKLQQYLTDATAAKIDGYVLYKEYLDAEIEKWKSKKEALMEMCDHVIWVKELQLKSLKQTLIDLNEQGLIGDYLMGKDKAIEIRPNSKPSVNLLGRADDPLLPARYKKREEKWVADSEALAQAHQDGEDVSGWATVTWGKQVRFKNAPRRRKSQADALKRGKS
jgi:hypothetical protein